jgi:hypothetical protein
MFSCASMGGGTIVRVPAFWRYVVYRLTGTNIFSSYAKKISFSKLYMTSLYLLIIVIIIFGVKMRISCNYFS